jgi:hypothetical protein
MNYEILISTKLTEVNLVVIDHDAVSLQSVDDLLVLLEERFHRVVQHLALSKALLDVCLVGAKGHQFLTSLDLEIHQVIKLRVKMGLLLDQGEDDEIRDLTSFRRDLHNEITQGSCVEYTYIIKFQENISFFEI